MFDLYKIRRFILLISFIMGIMSYTYGQNKRDQYIKNKLQKIDSLIAVNQYDKAVFLIKNTQDTFSIKSNSEEKFKFDYRYAQVLFETGEKEKALEIILKGFEILRTKSDSHLIIEYSNLLAKIFANSKNYDRAIHYNHVALNKSEKYKDSVNIIRTLIRLGSFHYAKNEIDSAKIYFRKVTHFSVTPGTEQGIAKAYNNLGVIAELNNNFSLAKHYYTKTFQVSEKQRDSVGMSRAILNLGNLYFWQQDYEGAISNYQNALNFSKDSTNVALAFKKRSYDNIAISYDSLGDYEKAYYYLLKYRDLNEDINEKILNNKFTETEAKFNLAKEEKKTEQERNKVLRTQILFYGLAFVTLTFFIIIFIFYKNYKLRQQNRLEQFQNDAQTRIINATIDAKEKERKNIAEILHDSVSALLSSANLHLQASKAQLNAKAPVEISKAQQIVGEASVKIRDLSHELISSVLLKFGLAFAVNDLCEKYSNSDFTLISDSNGVKRYHQEYEIKIYNIIEELINNIIKHSEAKNASIILIERNKDKLIIQIIDDGVGFDVKKAYKKNGLGLSHIEARIKIMKGVFNINSKKGEGTSIFISTPIFQPEVVEEV